MHAHALTTWKSRRRSCPDPSPAYPKKPTAPTCRADHGAFPAAEGPRETPVLLQTVAGSTQEALLRGLVLDSAEGSDPPSRLHVSRERRPERGSTGGRQGQNRRG